MGGTVPWKKMKEETVGEKKGPHELWQLPTSLAAFMDQFKESEGLPRLKLNLAKLYKSAASPNYTHSVMET